MFDVDRFKDVNDCHGHLMGDACLRTIAGCIRRAYGNYGTCFRIGGDEFCVILTRRNAQYNTMTEIFQHLMDAARAENPVLPTVSVGCSHLIRRRMSWRIPWRGRTRGCIRIRKRIDKHSRDE